MTGELDALLDTKKALESEAESVNVRFKEVKVSKEAITAFKKILSNIDSIDENYHWYLPGLPLLKGQAMAELSRNEVIVKQFEKSIQNSNPFKITS